MTILAILIPASLLLGGLGLAAFLWTVHSRQYEDLDGAGWRILIDDDPPTPAPPTPGPPKDATLDTAPLPPDAPDPET